jgi:hypothetical protein
MTRSFPIALTLLLAASVAALAAEPLPRLRKEQDYARTRQSLQAQGWVPVTLPGADTCQGGDARCEGRPEMFACAGSGMAQCVFTWRRDTTVIDVVTLREGPALFSAVRCRSGCR